MSRKERSRRTHTARIEQSAALGQLAVPQQPIIKRPAMNALEGSQELGDSLYENRKPRTWRTLGDPTREEKLDALLADYDNRFAGIPTCGSDFAGSRPADPAQIAVLRAEVAKNNDRRRWEQWAEGMLSDPSLTYRQKQEVREALRKYLEENE